MPRLSVDLLVLIVALVQLAGCAARQAVILVPDPNGQVGTAEVTTAGGSRVLEKSGDMTRISGSAAPPLPVTTADPNYIAVTFAEALAVEPPPAEKFILFFETGRCVLMPQSQPTIELIAAAVKRRGAITVAVSGHTDAVGSDQLNDRLAHARAVAVKELLLQSGISPDRLTVSSHGKGNPLIPTPNGVAEPKNRRVEVVVR